MVNESYNKGPKLMKIDHEEAKKKISSIISKMNNGSKIIHAVSPKARKFIEGQSSQFDDENVNLPNSVKQNFRVKTLVSPNKNVNYSNLP